MKEIERGSTLVFVTKDNVVLSESSPDFQKEFGVKLLFITEKADLVGIVPPEPVKYVADYDTGKIMQLSKEVAIAKDSVFTSDRALTNEEKRDRAIRSMGSGPDASVGVALGVAPVVDCDVPDPVVKKHEDRMSKVLKTVGTIAKVISFFESQNKIEMVVTPVNGFITHQDFYTVLRDVMNVENVKTLGGSVNVEIRGSLLDAEPVTDCDVTDDFDLTQLPSGHGFTYSAEASKEVIDFIIGNADLKAYQAQDFYRKLMVHIAPLITVEPDMTKFYIGDETRKQVFEPWAMTDLSNLQGVLDAVERALQPKPAAKPDTSIDPVELHRAAVEAHVDAEKYAEAITALPEDFQSEGREMMVNEYFERQRKAENATIETKLRYSEFPKGEESKAWPSRSTWHYHIKLRHSQILRVLTDQ